jgi:hypothetical protein
MLAGMSGSQFESWVAYYAIEPFGEQRAELRNGVLGSILLNIFKPRQGGWAPADVMMYQERDMAPPLSRKEVAQQVRAALGGLARQTNKGAPRARKR